ncbi:MAG TPA: transcription-repair coupling factor, partial [Cyclobacteriaceae bacterium]|nr:transcription-repair coupling factor [Cyclobacteriaceae bacterium]
MRAQDFLNIYCADGLIKTVAAGIHAAKNQNIRLKGLAGSFDAVITASSFKLHPHDYFIVLQDKEEAAYFQNDLQNLLGREILLFPMSYKRPYEFLEIENANILMRAEVLNRLAEKTKPEIIVTYPEALSEKVINKRSLATNTFTVKLKEKLEIPFLEEFLHSYDFEKTDFVYEAGQFSVRGGIIDVFSFAHELPYRIELFGDEVDSIRSFDPGSQLSVDTLTQISIIPNVQTKLMQEERQSLLDFIAPTTRLWFKDFQLTLDVLKKSFEKAEESFDSIVQQSGAQVVLKPEQLFEVAKTFKSRSESFQRIEFGSRAILNDAIVFDLPSAAQPSFNKNFELLAGNLVEHQAQGYSNFIAADIAKQQDRLKEIFEEIHPEIRFQPLEFALREGF